MAVKIEVQVSDHGCGRYSVQLFREGTLIEDRNIVKEINGWVVSGASERYDGPQHNTPAAAAHHYARLVIDEGSR